MKNVTEQHTEKVSPIVNTLETLGLFKRIEVSASSGDVEHNGESESFGVDDNITIQAWHANDDDMYPILDITITAGGFISGCPCSDDEYYLDEDGDFDEERYYADVNARMEVLDMDYEERLNFLIHSISFDDSNGDFSYGIEFESGRYGGWNAEELDELNTYLQSDKFAEELAVAIADNAEEGVA